MTRFARWFVLLGMAAAVPAAILSGSTMGEALRRPNAALEALLQREGIVLALGVFAVFLFRTASGLRAERTWGLHVGIGMSVLLVMLGIGGLVAGGALMEAMGLARELMLGTLPLSLGAILLGARLLVGLWPFAEVGLPFGWRDVVAIGVLGVVVLAAMVSHVLVSRIPT